MIDQMRDWLADCTFVDVDADDIKAMPDDRIIRAVARNYDGGIAGFIKAGN